MTVAKEIENKVNLIPRENIFTIDDLQLPSEWWENVRVKLGRMVNRGLLKKVGKGRYYRPFTTIFGTNAPVQEEMVKDLLEKDGKQIGYLTGYNRWNQMGLTSQISNTIQIGTNIPKRNTKRGIYSIKFLTQPNEISKENIKYLIILDAINNIKKIPDTSIEESVARLSMILKGLTEKEIEILILLAQKYPPSLRALLGAMLEEIGLGKYTDVLYCSLNPLTTYKYPEVTKVLTNTSKWYIR